MATPADIRNQPLVSFIVTYYNLPVDLLCSCIDSIQALSLQPEEREIIVCVSAPSAGWIRYLKDTKLTLTPDKQSFTYEFEMTEKDDNNGRLEFNMGHRGSTATIYISNVRVEEIK